MGRRRATTVAVTALALGVSLVALPAGAQETDGRYQDFGDPGGFHNIVPPGQDGVLSGPEALTAQGGETPEHFDDQLELYADLVLDDATPGFSADDLDDYFKDASFGVEPDDVDRVYTPGEREDVVVIRDASFGVPHIFGDTREGAMFANGYTGAEDRLFLMDVLRHVGRAELSAFLGASPANLAMDADQLAAAPYTEADLEAQIEAFRNSDDPTLRRVFTDGQAYVEGVNRYISEALTDPDKLPAEYPALQQTPDEFVPADIVAIASLVGGIFGKGGGREVANACGIDTLAADVGDERAREIFDDVKLADDPEAPVTARGEAFPYLSDLGDLDPSSVPDLDCDSLEPISAPEPDPTTLQVEDLVPTPPAPAGDSGERVVDLPWGEQMPLDLDMGMSNALLVNGARTDNGNPIAVFGPQTGYFAPQLLVEKDVHAPGIDSRGVAFAGTDIYVQLGRGRDYAWSATSASADNVDQFVLELCDPEGADPDTDSMGYRYDGECEDIEAHTETFVAKPSAGGVPESPEDVLYVKHFERAPDYGPLTARGETSDGTPIAVAVQRSTYTDELGSARGFQQINDPGFMDDGVDTFRQAMGAGVDYTFNWFYADGDDVAYQHSCRCPQRADGTDPYLPTWGTGEWDWTGDFLDLDEQPQTVNPSDGYITSWNNKQADGFRTNDGDFSKGPQYRSLMLDDRIEATMHDGPVDVGEAVDVMALAATTDLRAQESLPLLERVMGSEAPEGADDRAQTMFDLLREWHDDDLGHRRDHDGDGDYEHAQAVAIMDAWWPLLFDAIFAEGSANAREALGFGIHDAPQQHLGSAFNGGAYSHPDKDLRTVLGDDVAAPFSREYCGDGDLDACRDDLWASLSAAADDLTDEFEAEQVDDWRRTVADDAIQHSAVGVVGVEDIPWQNRPTFQQVVQVPEPDAPGRGNRPDDPGGHAPGPPDDPGGGPGPPDATDLAGAPLPATGGGAALAGIAALLGTAVLRRRR